VILIGDIDIGAEVDIFADLDAQMAADTRVAAYQASITEHNDSITDQRLVGTHPGAQ